MGEGLSPDDEWAASHLPPADARTWRHPSEFGRPARPSMAVPTAPTVPKSRRARRFSAASLLLAAAGGALAMLVGLALTDMLGNPARTADDAAGLIGTTTLGSNPALTPADGIVTIRIDHDGTRTHRVGLVVDRHGDIVTALPLIGSSTLSDSSASSDDTLAATMSVRTVDGEWVPADYLGRDDHTGLGVVRIVGGADTQPAAAVTPSLGDRVHLARASSTSDPIVISGERAERIVGINTTVRRAEGTAVGLATFTTGVPGEEIDLVVSTADGRVMGLVSSADEHRGDDLAHAVPATIALRVGRQIVLDGAANHGRLDAELAMGPGGVVVVAVGADSNAARAGLRAGDVIESLAGVPVDSIDDLAGALLTRGNATVEVGMLRSGQRVTRAIEPRSTVDTDVTFAAFTAGGEAALGDLPG
ncbi:MAG: PDZ domain-containing protein [Actinobacteria bacterium]|nr:PDZ domain-containing protein [Actinomycetota bacterium]